MEIKTKTFRVIQFNGTFASMQQIIEEFNIHDEIQFKMNKDGMISDFIIDPLPNGSMQAVYTNDDYANLIVHADQYLTRDNNQLFKVMEGEDFDA